MQYIPDVLSYFQIPKEVKTKRFKRKSTKKHLHKGNAQNIKEKTPTNTKWSAHITTDYSLNKISEFIHINLSCISVMS